MKVVGASFCSLLLLISVIIFTTLTCVNGFKVTHRYRFYRGRPIPRDSSIRLTAQKKDNSIFKRIETSLANPFGVIDHKDDGDEDRDVSYELRMTRKRNKQVISTFIRFLHYCLIQILQYTKFVIISSIVASTAVIVANVQRSVTAVSTKFTYSAIDFVIFIAKEFVKIITSLLFRKRIPPHDHAPGSGSTDVRNQGPVSTPIEDLKLRTEAPEFIG
jgi:hypothetical protein